MSKVVLGQIDYGSRTKPMEDEEKTKNESLAIIGEFSDLPRLVVVDLDYTLWPFYCEFGEENDEPHLYKEASGILRAFSEKGIHVAVASRTPSPEIATAFLTKLGLHSVFVAQEIYPSWSHKTEHFQRIQTKTEIPFKSMLFFDDENRNIQAVSKMGVTSILVRNGVSLEALRQGLAEFARNSGSI